MTSYGAKEEEERKESHYFSEVKFHPLCCRIIKGKRQSHPLCAMMLVIVARVRAERVKKSANEFLRLRLRTKQVVLGNCAQGNKVGRRRKRTDFSS